MKTDILKLEQYDDFFTILDKIKWCKSNRVLLVFPKKKRRLLSQVELSRLQHNADQQGSQIAIVSSSGATLAIAKELGIPTFSSVILAQRKRWETAERVTADRGIKGFDTIQKKDLLVSQAHQLNKISLPLARLSVLIVVAALFCLFLFAVPSVTVNIYPQNEIQTIELEVKASTDATTANINGLIPLYSGELIMNGTLSKESTGVTNLPLSRSTGEVTLVNLGTESIFVPAGLTLRTTLDPIIWFTTMQNIQITPGDQGVVVKVEALESGLAGNISFEEQLVVEGNLAAIIMVQSHSFFKGGTSSESATPAEHDYQELRNVLMTDLANQAATQAESQNSGTLPGTLQAAEVIDEIQVYQVGLPSDQAELTMSVRFTYDYYAPDDIEWIGKQLMDQALDSSDQVANGKVSIVTQTEPSVSNEETSWQVVMKREIRNQIDLAKLKQALRGKHISEGLAYLNHTIANTRPAEISRRFLVFDWFPLFSERIYLEEVYGNQG